MPPKSGQHSKIPIVLYPEERRTKYDKTKKATSFQKCSAHGDCDDPGFGTS